MAYDEALAQKIRDYLSGRKDVTEKKMMGGLTFMVDGKMCVGASRNGFMIRFDPTRHPEFAKRPGTKPMEMRGRAYEGFLYVDAGEYRNEDSFRFWMETALDYNKTAKSSKAAK